MCVGVCVYVRVCVCVCVYDVLICANSHCLHQPSHTYMHTSTHTHMFLHMRTRTGVIWVVFMLKKWSKNNF